MHKIRGVAHLVWMLLSGALILLSCAAPKNEMTKEMGVVREVDLARYAGRWYEIARLPHSFEEGLVGVTATYTLGDRGKIEVLNQGYQGSFSGEPKEIRGTAVVPDPKEPGKVKVYFFPFIGADYWILELDQQDYQYALVGSSSPNYLWILSRTPEMDSRTYEQLVKKAAQRGLPVEKLIKVPQQR